MRRHYFTLREPVSRAFRYSSRALALAALGSGAAFAAATCLLGFVPLAAPVGWAAAAVAAIFLVYFARTVCRQLTRIELDESGVRARGPLGAAIRWEELRSLRLDYYSTRGDREGGWMQLRLRDGRRTIRIDSELEGFAELVRAAAREAAARGLPLDAATLANLGTLGL